MCCLHFAVVCGIQSNVMKMFGCRTLKIDIIDSRLCYLATPFDWLILINHVSNLPTQMYSICHHFLIIRNSMFSMRKFYKFHWKLNLLHWVWKWIEPELNSFHSNKKSIDVIQSFIISSSNEVYVTFKLWNESWRLQLNSSLITPH